MKKFCQVEITVNKLKDEWENTYDSTIKTCYFPRYEAVLEIDKMKRKQSSSNMVTGYEQAVYKKGNTNDSFFFTNDS